VPSKYSVIVKNGFMSLSGGSCGRLHPAVVVAGMDPDDGEEISVQAAYTPESSCWGCGQAAESGLHLQSFRGEGGLQADLTIPKQFQAFPGIVNGGIVNVAFDCHGNWTAAIALMDKAALPKPPFTLSSSLQVQYHDVTPPETPLKLESKVVSIVENERTGNHKVTVDLSLAALLPDDVKKVLVSGRGVFIKRGASRSL